MKRFEINKQYVTVALYAFGVAAASFLFATQNIPIIVNLMSFSWGIVSGCFIGPYIWGLFSRRITRLGAYAGIVTGLLTVGGATLVISLRSGFAAAAAASPEMGVCAMALSFAAVPLFSLIGRRTEKEKARVEGIFACYHEDI